MLFLEYKLLILWSTIKRDTVVSKSYTQNKVCESFQLLRWLKEAGQFWIVVCNLDLRGENTVLYASQMVRSIQCGFLLQFMDRGKYTATCIFSNDASSWTEYQTFFCMELVFKGVTSLSNSIHKPPAKD